MERMAAPSQNKRRYVLGGAIILAFHLQGCTSGHPTTGAITSSAWTLYAEEAAQGKQSLEISLGAEQVYQSMEETLKAVEGMRVAEMEPATRSVTMKGEQASLTAQATDVGDGTTLVIIWADTGASGRPAKGLLEATQRAICGGLDAACRPRER